MNPVKETVNEFDRELRNAKRATAKIEFRQFVRFITSKPGRKAPKQRKVVIEC